MNLKLAHFMDEFAKITSAFICIPGAIFNASLMILILKCTPKQMRSYSVFLFNFASFDFLTCIISFYSCQKVIFSGLSLIYVFHGPCKNYSSWFCYFCHSFECHTLAHSQWILLASFIYRYLVIVGTFPSVRSMILVSIALYSVSATFLISYLFDIGDSAVLFDIMDKLHPEYHYKSKELWGDLTLSGNKSITSPICALSILYMTFPCVLIYVAIQYFRNMTLKILDGSVINMSQVAKSSHRKLIQALTAQALIPVFWLVASAIYTLAEFGIISGPIPENITFRLMDCMPMISPLVSIFFISHYRLAVIEVFKKPLKIVNPTAISAVDASITRSATNLMRNQSRGI